MKDITAIISIKENLDTRGSSLELLESLGEVEVTAIISIKENLDTRGSSLELLESLGEVEVGNAIFQNAKRVGVNIGKFHDARLSVWGEGQTIAKAADACVAKLVAAGVLPEECIAIDVN